MARRRSDARRSSWPGSGMCRCPHGSCSVVGLFRFSRCVSATRFRLLVTRVACFFGSCIAAYWRGSRSVVNYGRSSERSVLVRSRGLADSRRALWLRDCSSCLDRRSRVSLVGSRGVWACRFVDHAGGVVGSGESVRGGVLQCCCSLALLCLCRMQHRLACIGLFAVSLCAGSLWVCPDLRRVFYVVYVAQWSLLWVLR